MNINATIIVQAFNFFIVYWMLRCFLFKPAIKIIDHENAEKGAMIALIDQQKKSLEIQEKERKRHWFMCQEYFGIHKPLVGRLPFSFFKGTDNGSLSPQVSDGVVNDLVADAYKILEEKIKNVH